MAPSFDLECILTQMIAQDSHTHFHVGVECR